MQIISHRGYWTKPEEKNKIDAFVNSFSIGLGTETDFRDFNTEVVISHDIATSEAPNADIFFKLYNDHHCNGPLAINIKSDGLQYAIKKLIEINNITNYFVFDMSIPDTIGYINHDMPFFSRQSEYEQEPAFYEKCSGIWLDAFDDTWYDNDLILTHVKNNKKVGIVSPELHHRDHISLWRQLKQGNIHQVENVILCSDFPEEAIAYFRNPE